MLDSRISPSTGVSTIFEMLERTKNAPKDKIALTMRKNGKYINVMYSELLSKIRAMSASLLRLGIKKGDKIGLFAENRNEWILSYLATTYFGAIIVPFDSALKSEQLAHLIRNSDIRMIFTSSRYIETVEEAVQMVSNIEKIILFDADEERLKCEDPSIIDRILGRKKELNFLKNWEEIAVLEAEKEHPYKNSKYLYFSALEKTGMVLNKKKIYKFLDLQPDKDDVAAIIFTSGTTGMPKGVMLTHGNLVLDGDAILQTATTVPNENWVIILPLHHTFPAIGGIFIPLLLFSRITLVDTLRPDVLTKIMKDTEVTILPAVPLLVQKMYKKILTTAKKKPFHIRTMFNFLRFISWVAYKYFHKHIGEILFKSLRKQMGMEHFRFFIIGGGAMPVEVIHGMNVLGLRALQGYGLTETSPVISTESLVYSRPGSVGLPISCVKVKIVNKDKKGHGEILVKGASIMKGYYKNEEETKKVFDNDGWFHTGDIGKIDKDGFLYITGRLKNIIVTEGGKNIYPEEIENYLLESEYIEEVVVIGERDKKGVEFPVAIIRPNMEFIDLLESEKSKSFKEEDLKEILFKEVNKINEKLEYYKRIKQIEISYEELPKTSTNKVKRFMFSKK